MIITPKECDVVPQAFKREQTGKNLLMLIKYCRKSQRKW